MLEGNEFVAELFGLPLEFCFEPLLPLSISGGPDCFVIFDLIQNHGVKDYGDLCAVAVMAALGPSLAFILRR